MSASKTVGEYKRNQEKTRNFWLEESRAANQTGTSQTAGPS